MNLKDYTRANDFDRVLGTLQTLNVIKYGAGVSILDIGCGFGEYSKLYLKRFHRVVGLDVLESCVNEAKKLNHEIDFILGDASCFKLPEKFGTISLNNVLEHVESPLRVLVNARHHLLSDGRIIIHVPNRETIARKLGVLMGIIPSVYDISEKEREFFGHKRTYDIESLISECEKASLNVEKIGGLLYKPLPNTDLWELYKNKGEVFLDALMKFGEDRPEECSTLYAVCK